MPTEKNDLHQNMRAEQLSALDTTSHLLTTSSFDLDRLLHEICRITAQTLDMKACTIRLLDKESGEMVLSAAYGLSTHYLSKGTIIAAKSAFREVMEKGDATEIFDVGQDSRLQYPKEALAEGIRSRLDIGLIRDERAIGALSVFTGQPHHFAEYEKRAFQTIANQAAVAIHLAQLHRERLNLERIQQELRIAADIQAQMMPKQPPTPAGVDIAAWNRPCLEMGGDFYDFIELPGQNIGIAVGDVAGKGIGAALLMATTRMALRVQAENIYAMRQVITRVNRALCRDTQFGQFVTLFYGVFNTRERVLTYVNAGHNPPYIFRAGQTLPLETGGMVIGMFDDATYQEGRVNLLPGDVFVGYTDGYTEVPNRSGESFGEERLCEVVRQHLHRTPDEIVEQLEDAVAQYEHVGGIYCDDRTIVVVQIDKE